MANETDILEQWRIAGRREVPKGIGELSDLFIQIIEDKQCVEVEYTDRAGFGGTRRIYPKRIYHVKGYHRIYIAEDCPECEGEERTFRLDRMKILTVIDPPANPPEEKPQHLFRRIYEWLVRILGIKPQRQ